MSEYKRWLSLDEQIAQLKVKGVQFSIMDENAARDYLFRQTIIFVSRHIAAISSGIPADQKWGSMCDWNLLIWWISQALIVCCVI